jgi:dethiobiotin synthetase
MTKGLFITGTDTGVGKTYVATGLVTALRLRGVNVGVMKPAETGCSARSGQLIPRDALRLIKAAGVRDSLALVNPYRFRKPLAPFVAAEWERKKVNMGKIINAYQTLLTRHDFMIVEGAGGIMVPLSQDATYLDLAKALGIPVMIVARPGLGTINHTLLTVSALREKKITVAGIVINYADGRKAGLAEKTSPAVMKIISGVEIIGIITYRSKKFLMIADYLQDPLFGRQ